MYTMRQVLQVTVLGVNDDVFLYPSCPHCFTKLTHIGHSGFQCFKCSARFNDGQFNYRFRLHLQVLRGYTKCNIVAFGKCLQEIFGANANEFHSFLSHHKHVISSHMVHSAVHSCSVGLPFFLAVDRMPSGQNNQGKHNSESWLAYQIKCAAPDGMPLSVLDCLRAIVDDIAGSPNGNGANKNQQCFSVRKISMGRRRRSSCTVSQNHGSFVLSCGTASGSQLSQSTLTSSVISSVSAGDLFTSASLSCVFDSQGPCHDISEKLSESVSWCHKEKSRLEDFALHCECKSSSSCSSVSDRLRYVWCGKRKLLPDVSEHDDSVCLTKKSKPTSMSDKKCCRNLSGSAALTGEDSDTGQNTKVATSPVDMNSYNFIHTDHSKAKCVGDRESVGNQATNGHCNSLILESHQLVGGTNDQYCTWENLPDSEDLDVFLMKMGKEHMCCVTFPDNVTDDGICSCHGDVNDKLSKSDTIASLFSQCNSVSDNAIVNACSAEEAEQTSCDRISREKQKSDTLSYRRLSKLLDVPLSQVDMFDDDFSHEKLGQESGDKLDTISFNEKVNLTCFSKDLFDSSNCSVDTDISVLVEPVVGQNLLLGVKPKQSDVAIFEPPISKIGDLHSIVPDTQEDMENSQGNGASASTARKSVRFHKRLSCQVDIQQIDLQLKFAGKWGRGMQNFSKPCIKQSQKKVTELNLTKEIKDGAVNKSKDSMCRYFCGDSSNECLSPNLFSKSVSSCLGNLESSEATRLSVAWEEDESVCFSGKKLLSDDTSKESRGSGSSLSHSTPFSDRTNLRLPEDACTEASSLRSICFESQELFSPSPIPKSLGNDTPDLFEDSESIQDYVCKELFQGLIN